MNYRILLILILNAFAAAGIGAISIDVVQKMQVQGLGATWLAISASAWAIPSLVLGRRLNKLADFFDDIKITASAMAIASIVSIVYTLTTEPLVWILLQAISGATFSIFWITSEKYLSMFAKRNSTGLIFTIYAAVPVFGYTLGILIQQYSSENPNLIYYLAAGARFLTASMFLLLSNASQIDTSKIRAPDPSSANPSQTYNYSTIIQLALIAGFLEALPWGIAQAFFLNLGWNSWLSSSLIFSFFWGQLCLSAVLGKAIDFLQPKLILSSIGIGLIIIGVFTHLNHQTIVLQLALFFILGGLSGAIYGLGLSLISKKSTESELANEYAVYLKYFCVGALLIGGFAGYAMDNLGQAIYPISLAAIGFWIILIFYNPYR